MAAEYVAGWLQVQEPVDWTGTECPRCGFDAVVQFPLVLLTRTGVTPFGSMPGCLRCDSDEGSDDG